LDSLVSQSIGTNAFEVVVIDNGSTDGTRDIVETYEGSLRLSYMSEPEPGLHIGRHAGAQAASSDILVFADDDIMAGARWIESIVESFSHPDVALVGGNNLPLFDQNPPDWLSRWWESPVGRGRALSYLSILDFGGGLFDISPYYVWGCNFAVRRQVLLRAGGFHPDAFPKERLRWRGDGETHVSRWVVKNGLRAVFNSGASVHHRVPRSRMTPDYFSERAYAQGISDSYTDIRARVLGGQTAHAAFPRRVVLNWMSRAKERCTPASDQVGKQLRGVKLAALRSWRAGYRFHQQSVREDPDLLVWVTRTTYS